MHTLAQVIIAAVDDTDRGPVVIFGGRSEIGTELARRLAPGATVVLAARRADQLSEQVTAVRARRANYVYGSAKAGLDGFASGLADALYGSGVRLLIVRPGFVIGQMTQGMQPAPLSSTAPQVAAATARALAKGRRTVWIPRALRPLAFGMRLAPQWVWRRMPR